MTSRQETALPPLPEFEEKSTFGGRLVRRTVSLTLGGLLLLAFIGLLVLYLVPVEITVEASGVLEPLQVWRVHSLTSGAVREVPVRSGQEVAAGQTLCRLDGFALETELERLRLEARHKRHRPETPRVEMELLDQAILTAEERLQRLTVVAPESGILLSEDLDQMLGAYVNEGQLLFEIGTQGVWKAALRVPEREIDPIQIGDPVRVEVPALVEAGQWMREALPASVTFVGSDLLPASTPSRGLYRVVAALDMERISPPELERFRRGMTVEAHVITRSVRAIDLVMRHFQRQAGGNA